MAIYERPILTWRDRRILDAQSRLNLAESTMSEHYWDFFHGGHMRITTAGVAANGILSVDGGNWSPTAGGGGTGTVSWRAANLNGSAPIHISNPKTKAWYIAAWGKYIGTKVNSQTRVGWGFISGGTYYVLGVEATTSTFFQFIYGATTISSAVAIESSNYHLFEVWHNTSTALVYIAVDGESPVTAADTNLPTGTAEFAGLTTTGTDAAAQQIATDKAIILTERAA